jgi:hypothetical protein
VTLIGDDRNLNRNWVGWISEVVAFSISLGSGSRATLRADQKAYWGTPPYPLLLDHLGVSATRAYSTRKLRSAYAGSAIRIRRSSDNAEQDIGFVGENLDTAAISTFVGANSAFVVKWYDQSGSALDATQPTVVNQPRIVNAGTLDVRNTKASVYYDGANHWLRTVTTNPWTAQTIGAIAAIDSPSPFPHGVGLVTGNGSFPIMGQAAATNYYNAGQLGPINIDNVATAVPPWSGVLHNVRVSSATGFSTTEYTYIGADRSPSSLWVGWIGEVVSFPVQLSTPNYATLYDNQKTYWGTP